MTATERRLCVPFRTFGDKISQISPKGRRRSNEDDCDRENIGVRHISSARKPVGGRLNNSSSAQKATQATPLSSPDNTATATATISSSGLLVPQGGRMTLSRAYSGGSIATINSQLGIIPLPHYANPASILPTRSPITPVSRYPLPPAWSTLHDRAICILDARDHSLAAMVLLMKRNFPELASTTLTLDALERRLKTLDLHIELDYWTVAQRLPGEIIGDETYWIEEGGLLFS